ncbi:MAG: DUF234 domain-containing protein [Nitrososphaeria archaeon]
MDLIAVNEKDRHAAFIEVKWSNLSEGEALRAIDRLRELFDTLHG